MDSGYLQNCSCLVRFADCFDEPCDCWPVERGNSSEQHLFRGETDDSCLYAEQSSPRDDVQRQSGDSEDCESLVVGKRGSVAVAPKLE